MLVHNGANAQRGKNAGSSPDFSNLVYKKGFVSGRERKIITPAIITVWLTRGDQMKPKELELLRKSVLRFLKKSGFKITVDHPQMPVLSDGDVTVSMGINVMTVNGVKHQFSDISVDRTGIFDIYAKSRIA